MKQFFKFFFASVLGTFITLVIIVFIFVIWIAASVSATENTYVSRNSLLHIKMDKPIHDRAPKGPDNIFNFASFSAQNAPGLNEVLENLHKAKVDPRISGIYLDLSTIPTGLSTLEEIRKGLLDFKESGKFILAYSENYTQKSYYMATVADKIYLNPEGTFLFKGMNAELTFYKGLMEKLDVDAQIIRGPNNKFKSAVEPFMYDKMSEPNRQQMKKLLQSIWDHMLTNISASRGIPVEKLNLLADELSIQFPMDAVNNQLIDGVKYKDEILAELRERLELEPRKKIKTTTMEKYAKAVVSEYHPYKGKDKIAVVYALGSIKGGEGDDLTIGSEKISKALRKARRDSTVKAIVLRVNSPGGSALASEVILREIKLAKAVKPVVASFGDYAASGGYYISCLADKILAEPTTLTGSIGVFGIIPNFQKLFNNKLGITFDEVGTNKNSAFYSVNRPLKANEKAIIQNQVVRIYDTFINHVANGRKMTPEQVDAIGQGRVWSGSDAIEIGLVDEIGGLEKAIAVAAKMAELDTYRLKELPYQEDPIEQLMKQLTGQTKVSLFKNELGPVYEHIDYLQTIHEMKGVQARLPYIIDIQ